MSRFLKIPYRSSLLVALMGATLVVAGCKTMEGDTAAADAQNATQVTQRAEQASQVALATKAEVPGTYEGLLPCADCEGIQTTYHINNDGTFVSNEVYKGTKDQFKTTGTWEYKNGVLLLKSASDPTQFLLRAEKNQIRLLDGDGNAVTGELADKYILKKAR